MSLLLAWYHLLASLALYESHRTVRIQVILLSLQLYALLAQLARSVKFRANLLMIFKLRRVHGLVTVRACDDCLQALAEVSFGLIEFDIGEATLEWARDRLLQASLNVGLVLFEAHLLTVHLTTFLPADDW